MSYQDPLGHPPEPTSYSSPPFTVPAYPGYGPPYGRRTNGMAIAAMVVSIAGFAMCPFVLCAVGAILGHLARKQIAESGEEGDGFATAGIIVGWIGFGISILVGAAYIAFVAVMVSTTSTY